MQSCGTCSLPEELCVCKSSVRIGPKLPTEIILTPIEVHEKEAKAFKESLDLEHFRRFAGLSEGERRGEFLGLAQQLAGQSTALVKALQQDQKNSALRQLMLVAVSIKKMALAYAMEPAADAAEKLADELDKASKPA